MPCSGPHPRARPVCRCGPVAAPAAWPPRRRWCWAACCWRPRALARWRAGAAAAGYGGGAGPVGLEPALPRAHGPGLCGLGWSVGLRFTHAIALHALRTLPQVLLCIALLMLVGLATAIALVLGTGMDP